MTFRVVSKPSNSPVRCPYRVVEPTTGREIEWISQYLDYETLRRLARLRQVFVTGQKSTCRKLRPLRWGLSANRTKLT
jgi:hypothetical protein